MSNEIITGRDVLRLIANGVNMDDIEYTYPARGRWEPLSMGGKWSVDHIAEDRDGVKFRRKPQTRVINGFTVPEPVREGLQRGQEVFVANPTSYNWHLKDVWVDAEIDRVRLQRGLIFYDLEAAIATAKAMCGIDPSKEN